jgi:N-acetylglutamate synthase-like GNAT family acetyltransferase
MGGIDPNLDVYAKLEDSGSLETFAAYIGNDMAGFATVMTYEVPHYSKKVATTESLFVSKKHRHSPAGIVLMNYIEKHARKSGCWVFFYSATKGSQLDKLLTFRKAARHSNNVYLVTL